MKTENHADMEKAEIVVLKYPDPLISGGSLFEMERLLNHVAITGGLVDSQVCQMHGTIKKATNLLSRCRNTFLHRQGAPLGRSAT